LKRVRLTWVATHPSQYLAPFLRYVTASCREIDVTALYASVPDASQYGREFAAPAVEWGVPLLDGYRSVVMRAARPNDVFSYDRLRGIDVPGVTQALARTDPDVVLVPGWHSMFLLRAIAAARRLHLPLMYRGDSHLDSSGAGLKRMLAHARARWLLRRFASGLAVGKKARAYLRALGIPETRLFDVPHCVDNAFFEAGAAAARQRGRPVLRRTFGIAPDAFTVLFAGKLAGHKNVDQLIAAVARCGNGIALHIVGSGPREEQLRDAVRQAGVEAVFSGFLNQQALVAAYASADCLALPSRETWGMVCNEALASGLPLVVSDAVGCAPDLAVPGATGAVFPYGDVDGLAIAIRRTRQLVAHDDHVSERCRMRAVDYSFDVAGAALANACLQTVAGTPIRGTRAA
jgi:glycosyltransferase involved in cell wall biosynthesis